MPASYPRDRSACMSQEGPSDCRFRIPGGVLQHHPERDVRFPYIYRISTHALVHSPDHFKTILIRVVDTSVEARIRNAQFVDSLSVPLGPNSLMDKHGTLFDILNTAPIYNYNISFLGLQELEPGTILFARPLREDGIYHEENDLVETWCLDG